MVGRRGSCKTNRLLFCRLHQVFVLDVHLLVVYDKMQFWMACKAAASPIKTLQFSAASFFPRSSSRTLMCTSLAQVIAADVKFAFIVDRAIVDWTLESHWIVPPANINANPLLEGRGVSAAKL
jgi:hypothetical protein